MEIKERSSRTLFVEASFTVETGEAERIAVDWSAKGGEGGTSCTFGRSPLNRDRANASSHQWNLIYKRNGRP